MSDSRIRVLFVDDNRQLVSAWQRLIEQQPDMLFAGSLSSADGLTDAARSARADAIIIDLTMDGPDPLGAVAELRRALPAVCTLVYSGHSRDEWGDKATRAGASAYMDKAEDPASVLATLRRLVPRTHAGG